MIPDLELSGGGYSRRTVVLVAGSEMGELLHAPLFERNLDGLLLSIEHFEQMSLASAFVEQPSTN